TSRRCAPSLAACRDAPGRAHWGHSYFFIVSRCEQNPLFIGLFSAPGWIRTSDLRIRSPLLYPAELRGRGGTSESSHGRWPMASLDKIEQKRVESGHEPKAGSGLG